MGTLVLGEALVDLICEHPVAGVADADAFAPYFGGAAANVCVAAARGGADVALAGGAGDDPWGHWLLERLTAEGVDVRWFALLPRIQTPVAFVTVDETGDPDFAIYGDGIQPAVASAADRLDEALAASDAFVFASNTLVGEREREVSLSARERALELGKHVVFDPNLRLHRWPSEDEALDVVRRCVPGVFLLKCNATEARLLTGEQDVEGAAEALLAAGAQHVAITLGADGAVLRGDPSADAPGLKAKVVNATGAGDAFLGTMLAFLSKAQYDPAALAEALPHAVREATRATERWGAV